MGLSPVLVSEDDLRRQFATGRYLERADEGEFGCCLLRESIAAISAEPAGTRNLTVGYLNDEGQRIFVVHLYLRPAAPGLRPQIGASGRPDPKWLYENAVVYRAVREVP